MNRSIEDTPIVFIGAGNLGSNLAKSLYRKGFRIVQIYSHTLESARQLAEQVEADYTNSLSEVCPDARLYIVSLKDAPFLELLPQIVAGKRSDALFVHTAGSIPMSIWQGKVERYGVLYPLQTFTKQREVDFSEIHLFVEASSDAEAAWLRDFASVLSQHVHTADSEQRRRLHLAAVFACNFSNHMYALANELVKHSGLPFEVLLPLIDETARKVHALPPQEAQTGPAVRFDQNVIGAHLQMLQHEPEMQSIYELISKSIHHYHE